MWHTQSLLPNIAKLLSSLSNLLLYINAHSIVESLIDFAFAALSADAQSECLQVPQ